MPTQRATGVILGRGSLGPMLLDPPEGLFQIEPGPQVFDVGAVDAGEGIGQGDQIVGHGSDGRPSGVRRSTKES